MKKYLIVLTLILGACTSFVGKTNYVELGPQNLSRQVQNAKDMPVFSGPDKVNKPCSHIAFYQVQRLPDNKNVIQREIEKIKELAAKRGANAILLRQYYNEGDAAYPINLASYFLKYLDNISEEDKERIIAYVDSQETANIHD